jgi:hypothetical protein
MRLRRLFVEKKRNIHTLLFLNTAFSIIDKLFQQEISNAEIKKKHVFAFILNDIASMICPSKFKNIFIPGGYIQSEKLGGDLIQKIMGLNHDDDETFIDDIDSGYYMGGTNLDIKYGCSGGMHHSFEKQYKKLRRSNSTSSLSSHGVKLTDTIKRNISSPLFDKQRFKKNNSKSSHHDQTFIGDENV